MGQEKVYQVGEQEDVSWGNPSYTAISCVADVGSALQAVSSSWTHTTCHGVVEYGRHGGVMDLTGLSQARSISLKVSTLDHQTSSMLSSAFLGG